MLGFIPANRGSHPLHEAWAEVKPDLFKVAVAFASEGGLEKLRRDIATPNLFDQASQEWLIGLQGGITQPQVLRRLTALSGSNVRVPFGSAVLRDPALRAPNFFHPKLYYLANSSTGQLKILSTSANLTFSGLSTNVEQFLVWAGASTDTEASAFNKWWQQLWNTADPATEAFTTEYEACRPTLADKGEPATDGPGNAALKDATSYWIELTRRPEGGSFNQVELLFNGHHFFYPDVSTPPVNVGRRLIFEDSHGTQFQNPNRQIMFNGPPLKPEGNHMWRVYMPTTTEGLSGYQDGDVLIRFQRTGFSDHYKIDIASTRDLASAQWIEQSAGLARHPGPPPRRMGWA